MSIKWQTLILIVIILISLTITKLYGISNPSGEEYTPTVSTSSYQKASISDLESIKNIPTRKWEVLDPEITTKASIVYSLDNNLPFFYKNTQDPQVLASLTKLLTSVVVIENIGLDKKIPITEQAIQTRGSAGGLKSGESYSARDLLKIMLLTSSNDAAAAFSEYIGGQEKMAQIINQKAIDLNMPSISVEDSSGLCDTNKGNAIDLLKLTKYILKNHPEIFTWTQSHDIWVQPWNGTNERKIYNIDNLVNKKDFLGGKTGTSQIAGQNLVSIFNIKDKRVALILMGSQDREQDVETLINWVKKAYSF